MTDVEAPKRWPAVPEVAQSAAPGRSFPLTNIMSAVTPDLYGPMYGAEVGAFLAFHSLNLPKMRCTELTKMLAWRLIDDRTENMVTGRSSGLLAALTTN
jgi:hypothetical protein